MKEVIDIKKPYSVSEHNHLDKLDCPKCGYEMKLIQDRTHMVGCMEFQIFTCRGEFNPSYFVVNGGKKPDDHYPILIINYPHDSAGKDNKIIEL